MVHTTDDHADIIGVSIPLDRSGEQCQLSLYDRVFGTVLEDVHMEGCLSRFWKLDDDGSYVIFFNSTTEGSCQVEGGGGDGDGDGTDERTVSEGGCSGMECMECVGWVYF